jgi:hypothetical protein
MSKQYSKKWCLRWSCRPSWNTKLGEDVQLSFVLADPVLISPHAGAAVSEVGGKGVH